MKAMITSIAAALAIASLASATEHIVRPGEDWSNLGPKLRPGDRVLLAPGAHIPAAFERVSGSADKPIVIRPVEDGVLAEIEPKREALKLTDCAHIRIERLSIKNARRAGIIIEANRQGASRDISISDVLVSGVGGLAEQSGIVIRGASEVGVRRSRLENCVGAALRIEHAEKITVEECQFFAQAGKPTQSGVAIEGVSSDIAVRRAFLRGPIETGVSIGFENPVFQTDAAEPARGTSASRKNDGAPPLVRRVDIIECRFKDVIRPLRFGSAEAAVVRQCTFLEPREEVYLLTVPPASFAAVEARFLDNLTVWAPGSLRRLCHAEPNAKPAGLKLGANLWWSKELPAALPSLGNADNPFLGTIETPQTLDRDPQMDDKGYPTAAEAMTFGAPRP